MSGISYNFTRKERTGHLHSSAPDSGEIYLHTLSTLDEPSRYNVMHYAASERLQPDVGPMGGSTYTVFVIRPGNHGETEERATPGVVLLHAYQNMPHLTSRGIDD